MMMLFCVRSETLMSGVTTMHFDGKALGDRSITTQDIIVSDMSVIQFDVCLWCFFHLFSHRKVDASFLLRLLSVWCRVKVWTILENHLSNSPFSFSRQFFHAALTVWHWWIVIILEKEVTHSLGDLSHAKRTHCHYLVHMLSIVLLLCS